MLFLALHTNPDSNTTNNSVVSGAVKAAADGSNVTANTALPTAPEQQQQQQQPQVSNTVKSESLSHVRKLFAQGERIPKNVCLDALDAIDQAKWFQNLNVYFCGRFLPLESLMKTTRVLASP
ncbi:hypothetical protein CSKR_113346 [Clonorchis sinensis]|uniref:Uncharacterized protein n=1 Tax=Clonorchis sinensis TaxID=79923 RepID=A0A3R7C5D5_CLOSI|nr:hypothetical protein CSKR_113346 [Clonorchis sinensis]